jgi:hypothetical protein
MNTLIVGGPLTGLSAFVSQCPIAVTAGVIGPLGKCAWQYG